MTPKGVDVNEYLWDATEDAKFEIKECSVPKKPKIKD